MPLRVSRREFLGASAAAGWALSQGQPVDAALDQCPVRLGLIGCGNRGTTLLRSLLEISGSHVVAVADPEARHRTRACGVAEKATGSRPDAYDDAEELLSREDIEAVVVAIPCDLHTHSYKQILGAGKHLYAEKPLALSVAECDELMQLTSAQTGLVFQVGYQRRSHPRYQAALELVRRGELGSLIEGRASWTSSNGPVLGHQGWLGRRERSGDWMLEQAVHIWDLYQWIHGDVPVRAYGHGRRNCFASLDPDRDVTDLYSVSLEWADGFRLNFVQSWIEPADDAFTGHSLRLLGSEGGMDLTTGTVTFRHRSRSRQVIHPGNQPDTRIALQTFLRSTRGLNSDCPPVTLSEAREATVTGLLVRQAVDECRVVERHEVLP